MSRDPKDAPGAGSAPPEGAKAPRTGSERLLHVYAIIAAIVTFGVGVWRLVLAVRTPDPKLLGFETLAFLLAPLLVALIPNVSEFSFGADGVSWKRDVKTKLDSADASLRELNTIVDRLKTIMVQGVGRRGTTARGTGVVGAMGLATASRSLRTLTDFQFKSGPNKGVIVPRYPVLDEPQAAEPEASPDEPATAEPDAPLPGDEDDPQKGRWGGSPERNHRRLTGRVERLEDDPEMYEVTLEVRSTDPNAHPLTGIVHFHLHPTFERSKVRCTVRDGVARLVRYAWGAFTVGAEADNGETRLELDLEQLEGAPREFREA